ncbi:MAG TPA: GNAT family N-acetyltransferase [Fimbriimonadaceae bacterium]|nr:GNAT family N-acetyltransferase [Fimbriimonadaceae bacterium]HRJ96661.1 GNAT family N-acetyltransferase [Fimbriimonadaceae bacterium]
MADIEYIDDLAQIRPDDLEGLCAGWRKPLSGAGLLKVLQGSDRVWLARDRLAVVGFINAISDGCLMAFVPLLEVRASHHGLRIGSTLVRKMMHTYRDFYGIDLLCDPSLCPFYERFGMSRVAGMVYRNRDAAMLVFRSEDSAR